MLLYIFLRHIRRLMAILDISVRVVETQSRDRNGRALSGMTIDILTNAFISKRTL